MFLPTAHVLQGNIFSHVCQFARGGDMFPFDHYLLLSHSTYIGTLIRSPLQTCALGTT